MERSYITALLVALSLMLVSCKFQYTPGSSNYNIGSGGSGNTPGSNSNGPVINAGILRMISITSGSFPVTSISTQCQVIIANPPPSSGPLAASGVTLIAPGNVHVPVAAVTTGMYMDPGNGWTYQPGQTYTIQIMIASTLYTASVVAPGNITIPDFPSPGPIVWTTPGNRDTITIMNQAISKTTLIGPVPPAASGQVSTASATYFPNSGNYSISVSSLEQDPAFGPNAYTISLIQATDMYNLTSTK